MTPPGDPVQYRIATAADAALLAAMNRQLAEDEHHRNAARDLAWFESRMTEWLADNWVAAIFSDGPDPLAYALWRDQDDGIYLRQFFVQRDRRRRGLGRQALHILLREVWPRDRRLTVEALTANPAAVAFWQAAGFRAYALTLELPAGERPEK